MLLQGEDELADRSVGPELVWGRSELSRRADVPAIRDEEPAAEPAATTAVQSFLQPQTGE